MKTIRDPSPIRKLILNTFPPAEVYKSYAPSLSQIYLFLGHLKDLVKIFVSWLFELMKLIVTHLDAIFFVMK